MSPRDTRSHYFKKKSTTHVNVKRIKEKLIVVPPKDRALVASSEQEYSKLRRDYPFRKIILDITYHQSVLFDTREFIDV